MFLASSTHSLNTSFCCHWENSWEGRRNIATALGGQMELANNAHTTGIFENNFQPAQPWFPLSIHDSSGFYIITFLIFHAPPLLHSSSPLSQHHKPLSIPSLTGKCHFHAHELCVCFHHTCLLYPGELFFFLLGWFMCLDVWHAPPRHKHMEGLFLEGYRCHLRYWKSRIQQCWGWSCECCPPCLLF